MSAKLDGLHEVVDPNELYYVQDTRSVVGNCALFWGKDRSGYVCNLAEAGQYTGKEVMSMRDTDVPWPVDVVHANTVTHVRTDALWTAMKHARCGACAKGLPRQLEGEAGELYWTHGPTPCTSP